MQIYTIEAGPVLTNGYIVYDEQTKEAAIIDVPPEGTELYLKKINELNLKPEAIILTHSHWDHSAEAPELKRRTGAPIYMHKADEYRIISPAQHSIFELPFELEPFKADNYLQDGQQLNLCSSQCEILHTPGHTEGGICIYFPNEKILFTGDTLFNMGVGRVDLPGGDWNTLYKSITEKLMVLPDDTNIYPGHGEPSTIGFEKGQNPFLNKDFLY